MRVKGGVKGRDANGVDFAVFYWQVAEINKTPYGAAVRLWTGELIPISCAGYDTVKATFKH